LQTNERLDELLMRAVTNTEELEKLRAELESGGKEGEA
jgi:hypothetical protein